MKNIDFLRQIKSGLWAIEPLYGLGYSETIINILSKKTASELIQKEDFSCKHYFIDSNLEKHPTSSLEASSGDMVGIIHCTGPMIKYGNYCVYGADELMAQAKKFDDAPNVIGQVWISDSGGGAINSIPLYLDFLNNKKKPVVDLADTCASASLWKGVATDFIMAQNTISSCFGSVGVLMSLRDVSEYWEKMGVKDHEIYADQSTHKNRAFKLVLEGKYEEIKREMLNPIAVKFQDFIKQRRPNLNLDIEGILNGRMFYAEEALEYGLIDGIGNLEAAVEKVHMLAAAQSIM